MQNCEWRLFQRPDDAIHPGFDKQTEDDMSRDGLFCSNFQPLDASDARDMVQDVAVHDAFTEPMRRHIETNAARNDDGSFICSAKPRLVGGKPSKNPRYLQVRPDVTRKREKYIAYMGARLYRRLPIEETLVFPVISVLSGRRNNPPDDGIRPLCVYGPIHYQELPELFMDYVCSLTGKSPSTTGAGTEGALTKGPFNAICATADLNNALVSILLCGYAGFSSAAGYIGPNGRVDHDVSLLIPEIWCRMFPAERDPARMIDEGHSGTPERLRIRREQGASEPAPVTASPPSSCTRSSVACSTIPVSVSVPPKASSSRRRKTQPCTPMASATSSKRTSALLALTSKTAASKMRVRRCARCST